MPPLIVNLDSHFDWTAEVLQIWQSFDWDGIRRSISPNVSSEKWIDRRDNLGLVALVSGLLIDDAYQLPQTQGREAGEEEPDQWALARWREHQAEWRDRQCQGREADEEEPDQGALERRREHQGEPRDRQRGEHWQERDDCEGRRHRRLRFSGQEPFFRSPCTGRNTIVECFGMYVDEAATILCPSGFLQAVPEALHRAPAVFLCPERIHEVYSNLARAAQAPPGLRHLPALASNPALLSLRTTLLHEIGHHFFPVHRSASVPFLSEGLANLFCYRGLDSEGKANLLYKSWHLQPPEYSAYRPLHVMCEADEDLRSAVATCFSGCLAGWSSLPEKEPLTLERSLGAAWTMAVGHDTAPRFRLVFGELRHLTPAQVKEWLSLPDGDFHMRRLDRSAPIPADFLLDLYSQADLSPWALGSHVPDDLGVSWGRGEDVRWPDDCVQVREEDVGRWLDVYALARSTARNIPWRSSLACRLITGLLERRPELANHLNLDPVVNQALTTAVDRGSLWFDRVAAIRLVAASRSTSAIPALEAVCAETENGRFGDLDLHSAARRAVSTLRAVLSHPS